MKPSRFARALDYAPPTIAFIAAIGAIMGAPKWNEQASGLARLTALGWTIVAVGLAALIASILMTRRNHNESTAQKAVQARLARLGQDHILRGLDRMVCLFRLSSYWHPKYEEPTSPLDLLSSERRSALSKLNLNSLSPYADGKGCVTWWKMFEDAATQGAAEITSALQIYVAFLDPEVVETASTLLTCEFHLRQQHIHDIVDANIRSEPNRPVRFFWVDPEERLDSGYTEYWNLVAKLIGLCAPGPLEEKVAWAKPGNRDVE